MDGQCIDPAVAEILGSYAHGVVVGTQLKWETCKKRKDDEKPICMERAEINAWKEKA